MRLDDPYPPTASLEEHQVLVAQRRLAIQEQRRAWGKRLAEMGRAAKRMKAMTSNVIQFPGRPR